MTTIQLLATDLVLIVALNPTVAAGGKKSVKLHVDFDTEWEGYAKSAVFFTDGHKKPIEMILDASGECLIPHEVLTKEGNLYIGVRGVKGAVEKPSTLVRYKIENGAPAGEGTTVEPAADVYQQLLFANSQLVGRMDALTSLSEGSTTGDAELIDARVDLDGRVWGNVGGHIRGIMSEVLDICCDKEVIFHGNYNLLRPSECTFSSRLEDASANIVSSNMYNVVTGWIPVAYGKFYTLSVLNPADERVTTLSGTAGQIARINTKSADGTVAFGQFATLVKGITSSWSTICINDPDIVAVQMHINYGSSDISSESLLKAIAPMFVEGETAEEAYNNALTLPFIDGDADTTIETIYTLKSDDNKADKADVEQLKADVSAMNSRTVDAAPQVYNDNLIHNERFIRGIANLRDETKAKEFEITVNNNSGATIKNAAIVVGLHNTVGVTPANNRMPFQIYDDVFSGTTGFKFFDGDTELPFYIESESECNYVVDKNILTSVKTMAVFSGGKIAVYNGTKARMQISDDDGVTWTNICNDITASPYRVLLPDSQDNLFVAENSGKKLYKYTSADGYMTGTVVLDLTDTDTKIGSILAEDSAGNLYLGTYQDIWHCVVRKSTDHGNTWTIVFDSNESQHVHNIFVNTKVTPNEIFIGLDGTGEYIRTYVSTDAGATWTFVDVPYQNREYAFRYAGENFYIGCGERNYLAGATLYKTSDYNDRNAYYPLFDNGQGVRDIINVVEGSDDVLLAGGCVDIAVNTEQLFLSEDRGETWKTVFMRPFYSKHNGAGQGMRTFSRKGDQILAESSTGEALRFVYGNGAKTIVAVVNIGDVPTDGKTITLKTGYVASVERLDNVLMGYENIDGKVADICICDGYVLDAVSNKRVLTADTEKVNAKIKLGQTPEHKIVTDHAHRLNGSANLGKLSRLNFTKGFTVSMLFRREDGKNYLADDKYHVIFQSGDTKLVLWYRSLCLMSGDTNMFAKSLHVSDAYLSSVNDDYVRITAYFTGDTLPVAKIFTENNCTVEDVTCTEYPIEQNLSDNDFVVGNVLADTSYAEMPNIARIEIYNRVLTVGEIMSLTNGCNLITDNSRYN